MEIDTPIMSAYQSACNFLDLPLDIVYLIVHYCGLSRFNLAATCRSLAQFACLNFQIPYYVKFNHITLRNDFSVLIDREKRMIGDENLRVDTLQNEGVPIYKNDLYIIWILAREATFDESLRYALNKLQRNHNVYWLINKFACRFFSEPDFDNVDFARFYLAFYQNEIYLRGGFANEKIARFFKNCFRANFNPVNNRIENYNFTFSLKFKNNELRKLFDCIVCDFTDELRSLFGYYFAEMNAGKLWACDVYNDAIKIAINFAAENCFVYLLDTTKEFDSSEFITQLVIHGTDNMFAAALNYLPDELNDEKIADIISMAPKINDRIYQRLDILGVPKWRIDGIKK